MNYLQIKTDWISNKILEAKPYPFREENLNIALYSRLEDHDRNELTYIVNIDEYADYFKDGIRALRRLPEESHNYVIGYRRRNKLKVIKNKINAKEKTTIY